MLVGTVYLIGILVLYRIGSLLRLLHYMLGILSGKNRRYLLMYFQKHSLLHKLLDMSPLQGTYHWGIVYIDCLLVLSILGNFHDKNHMYLLKYLGILLLDNLMGTLSPLDTLVQYSLNMLMLSLLYMLDTQYDKHHMYL